MSALVSQLLFLLLCKQWFISFFCICGIDIFDFMCSSQKVKKNCQSLWACLSMCLHGSISKCLSCLCAKCQDYQVCVFPVCLSSKRRTSFLQCQHSSTAVVLRFNPFLFFSYQWRFSLFPPLSLLLPKSLMFDFTPFTPSLHIYVSWWGKEAHVL